MKARTEGLLWLAILVISMLGAVIGHAQTAWTDCANEGGSCTLPVQKSVRYGEPFNNRWTAPRTLGPGTIPCTNEYWTDPSPGTGKRCQTQDIAATPPPVVTPPSGMLPPLATGETYVVSWDRPTTNTDGTPIGTITKTEVQASTLQDFATYYQWTADLPSATSVSVVNGPTGTVYWRARVTTPDGTSDYSATAISERTWVAQSKPTCWPKPVGSGTWVRGDQNSDGWALYWQCTDAGVAKHSGVYGLWSQMEPDWVKQLTSAIFSGTSAFDALWNAKASGPLDPAKYAPVKPLWEAMRDANPLPVVTAPTYKVKLNGTSSSRPAYALVGGLRTSTVAGRVAVGQPCDCVAHSSGVDPNRYCAVTGKENVATAAIDTLPASAAICAK